MIVPGTSSHLHDGAIVVELHRAAVVLAVFHQEFVVLIVIENSICIGPVSTAGLSSDVLLC